MAPTAAKATTDGLSRRSLFRGRLKEPPSALRPPWTDQARIVDGCSQCDSCIEACPEAVLVHGDGGFPEFSPAAGPHGEGCTFCGACAEACPQDLFSPTSVPPWDLKAVIGEACLASQGVACQSCGDACQPGALRFPPRLGGPPVPHLDTAFCTGCGACQPRCPGRAISLRPEASDHV